MADLERLRKYSDWLKSNADKQDTPEYQKVAQGASLLMREIRGTPAEAPSQAPQPQSTGGLLDSLGRGVRSVVSGFGSTAEVLGADETGKALQEVRPDVSATEQFVNRGRDGFNWSELPNAVAENLPDLGGGLAAAGAGAAMGSVVPGIGTVLGGLAGGALYGIGRGMGDTAKERAANDGRSEVSAGDIAVATGLSGGMGALEAVGAKGLGKVLGPTLGRGGVRGTIAGMGREAVTEGAENLAHQAGTTAGTERGLEVDPKAALGETIVGAGTAAAAGAPTVAKSAVVTPVKAGVRAAQDASAKRALSENPEQFESDLRVGRYIAAEAQAVDRYGAGNNQPTDVLYKNVLDGLEANANRLTNVLYEGGEVDKDGRAVLRRAIATAKKHNREGGEGDDGHLTAFDEVAQLNLADEDKQAFRVLLRDINTVSSNAFKKNRVGPVESFARTGIPKTAVSAMAGVATGPAGLLNQFTPNALYVKGGRAIDKALGLQEPAHTRRLRAMERTAEREGVDPGNPLSDFQSTLDAAKARAQASAFVRQSNAPPRAPSPVTRPGVPGALPQSPNVAPQATPESGLMGDLHQYIQDNGVVRGGGWLAGMEQGLSARVPGGVTQAEILEAIRGLSQEKGGKLRKEHVEEILGNTSGKMKEPQYYALHDILAHAITQARQAQQAPQPAANLPGQSASPARTPPAPDLSSPQYTPENTQGIRNLPAYLQTMDVLSKATTTAYVNAPTPEVQAAVAALANLRTIPEKVKAYEALKQGAQDPQLAQWVDQFVLPLTKFGPKAPPAPKPATTGKPTLTVVPKAAPKAPPAPQASPAQAPVQTSAPVATANDIVESNARRLAKLINSEAKTARLWAEEVGGVAIRKEGSGEGLALADLDPAVAESLPEILALGRLVSQSGKGNARRKVLQHEGLTLTFGRDAGDNNWVVLSVEPAAA